VHNPYVQDMTIIEINPGYKKLIPLYSNVASLLNDPKINFITEDGRRFLVRNSDEHYDAIVMNTSLYWRAGSTNLLSREFLEILRTHLNPGGVIMYNTTDSSIVQKTGVSVFPYAWRFTNAIILSDSPMPIDTRRLETVLRTYTIDGKTMIDTTTPRGNAALTRIITMIDPKQEFTEISPLESGEHLRMRTKDTPILTDDNMLIEWTKSS
jgi:spermidine synthase